MNLGRYFEVGTTVVRDTDERRESETNPIQVGTIVAEAEDGLRVQVQWSGFPNECQRLNTNKPKKTWIAKTSLNLRPQKQLERNA